MIFLRVERRAATVFLAAAMLALLELSAYVMDGGLPHVERSPLVQMVVAAIWIPLSCVMLFPLRGAGCRKTL
ncbi:MAG: hypothetical protein ACYC2T_02165 [Bacillota bacterium]